MTLKTSRNGDTAEAQVPAGTLIHYTIREVLEARWYESDKFFSFLVGIGLDDPIEVTGSGDPLFDGSIIWNPLNAIELSPTS